MNTLPANRRLTRAARSVLAISVLTLAATACVDVVGLGGRDLEILWPDENATLVDEEYLQVRLRGSRLEDYEVYWYVDDSREYRMWNEWDARPEHKAYIVDTYYWDWRGRGPYTVGFIAEDRHGREIAHRTVRVYVR